MDQTNLVGTLYKISTKDFIIIFVIVSSSDSEFTPAWIPVFIYLFFFWVAVPPGCVLNSLCSVNVMNSKKTELFLQHHVLQRDAGH